ncbi:DUF262 domain-containing HNH endonuclease family protein [Actinoplanes sp. NPDC049118]|uniref:DUF262 domain-containing protein n=1 Tax=Actinoplanes sp. NPDC049118 TaxID=3155769 RepID=UPI0033F86875
MATITAAAPKTIKDLFNESAEVVRVPTEVQRQYSWDEETETFWQDLRRFEAQASETDQYFVGSILTVWRPGSRFRLLLDGQQRLTTSTILLSSIRDALWRLESQNARTLASEVQRDFIAYAMDEGDEKKYFLQLTDFDKEFFRAHIQDWDPESGKSPGVKDVAAPSHKLILSAKRRFDAAIQKVLGDLSDEQQKRRWLQRLRRVLVRHIQFVEITTASEEDANEVFETINDRGLKLSPLDLLRNFLLRRAADYDRSEINDSWRFVLERAVDASDLEQFLRHYWVSRYGDVRARGLYKEIKYVLGRKFDNSELTPKAFALDLEGAANVYFDLRKQEVDDQEFRAVLGEIRELDAKPLYPVLLASVETLGESQSLPLARALVSYYVRWSVVGRKESTLLETVMYTLAIKIRGGLAISEAIAELRAQAGTDESFIEAFASVSIARSGWRHHVLVRLEDTLRRKTGKDELIVKPGNSVHVEHIYPQRPPQEYRLEQHEELVNRLGNLTLLHRRLNTSVKNSIFPKKAEKAYLATQLLLTTDTGISGLWDEEKSQWRKDGIEARQKQLASLAVETWPL